LFTGTRSISTGRFGSCALRARRFPTNFWPTSHRSGAHWPDRRLRLDRVRPRRAVSAAEQISDEPLRLMLALERGVGFLFRCYSNPTFTLAGVIYAGPRTSADPNEAIPGFEVIFCEARALHSARWNPRQAQMGTHQASRNGRRVNTPPPEGGGFGLRLKAGSVGLWAGCCQLLRRRLPLFESTFVDVSPPLSPLA
jgi:hypothetical protein